MSLAASQIGAHTVHPAHRFRQRVVCNSATAESEAAPGPKRRRRLRGVGRVKAAINAEAMGATAYLRDMPCASEAMLCGIIVIIRKATFCIAGGCRKTSSSQ